MCGRFTVIKSKEELEKRFGAKVCREKYQKRYNAAPSQELPVITNNVPELIQFYKWGLIPFWAKNEKIAHHLINAKAETITQKPSFRYAIKERRCLVCTDGYYEWENTEEGKVPYRISLKDESLFAFAGIWEVWKSGEGEETSSFSIITVSPSEEMKEIHNRMPVILTKEEEKLWIGNTPLHKVLKLLRPISAEHLKVQRVSTMVNSVKNDNPEVLDV